MKVLFKFFKIRNPNYDSSTQYYKDCNRFLEKDLLSTTSGEVCEIWNGRGVERVFSNTSPVREYIFTQDGSLIPIRKAKYGESGKLSNGYSNSSFNGNFSPSSTGNSSNPSDGNYGSPFDRDDPQQLQRTKSMYIFIVLQNQTDFLMR